jgi:hypothetical protein
MQARSPFPKYWELLTPEDQAAYLSLQHILANPGRSTRRQKGVHAFAEVLEQVKSFVAMKDDTDWKRSIVCGLYCSNLDSSIALNTRQLRLLISKCKSSINSSFQLLGYRIIASGNDCAAVVLNYFPILRENFADFRQWTVRQPEKFGWFIPPIETAVNDEKDHDCLGDWAKSPTELISELECVSSFEERSSWVPDCWQEGKWLNAEGMNWDGIDS